MVRELVRLRKSIRWVVFGSLVGLADSVWLLILHAGKGAVSAGCNLGPRVSCDPVFSQQYSEWFGIPVPVFSILFFLALIALAVWGYRAGGERRPPDVRPYALIWLLGWVGLVTAVAMAFIALVLLRSFCPYCSVLWVVLGILWWVSLRIQRLLGRPWSHLEAVRTLRTPWFWGGVIVVLSVLTACRIFFGSTAEQLLGAPVKIVGEEARSLGSSDAKVTIAVFSDFQCPWCRVASEVLRQVNQERPAETRVIFKFFPLDHHCNESMKRPMHLDSCAASLAAYCASVQEKFWVFHDYLFTSQSDLAESRLLGFARMTDLDLPSFEACRRDSRSMEEIRKNIREGISLQIQGTPAIFLNGRRYGGPITLQALRETIRSLP